MRERKRDKEVYAQTIAERDEAIVDRDFILKFLQEIGGALNADAVAAATHILTLRAMVRIAGEG